MLLELAVGAAETVLGAKACRWVRLLSAQAEAKQATVFQAADPLPVASAVRCGNRAGRVQGLLRGRVEAFQLAQEEVEVAAATLVVAGAFEHRHECRAAVTSSSSSKGPAAVASACQSVSATASRQLRGSPPMKALAGIS